jgi:RNA polymerase sigma-70 factor (ECF subfamily)
MDEARMHEVLRRAWDGEGEAFADLYRAFFPRVFGLCRRLLGSAQDAEDATSEVFLRAQRNLRSYDMRLPFAPWLFGIASHYCLDQLRRRRAERRLFEAPEWPVEASPDEADSPLRSLLLAHEQQALRATVAALPERERVLLALRYEAEMTYDQIASATGLEKSHVGVVLHRAKQKLRRALGPAGRDRAS